MLSEPIWLTRRMVQAKRVGYMARYVFLGTNGLDIEAPQEEVVILMTRVASGEWSEQQLAEWLRKRVVPYD